MDGGNRTRNCNRNIRSSAFSALQIKSPAWFWRGIKSVSCVYSCAFYGVYRLSFDGFFNSVKGATPAVNSPHKCNTLYEKRHFRCKAVNFKKRIVCHDKLNCNRRCAERVGRSSKYSLTVRQMPIDNGLKRIYTTANQTTQLLACTCM